MKISFKCTLLSDLVLTSSSATEGFHPSLDYIPGSKFLGIVARDHYNENNKDQTLDLFHNGKVKFGDAHLSIHGNYSYPAPFAWFEEKTTKDSSVFLHHALNKEIKTKLFDNGKQLKQIRGGYLDREGKHWLKPDQVFSIKSAYDKEKRRSEDEKMYGYHAIRAGSEYIFSVDVPDEGSYATLIENALTGKKRIGRSRTAEYGLVEIERLETEIPILEHCPGQKKGICLVYAVTNLCFFDAYGFPTTRVQASDLGIPQGKIQWKLSQVRYKRYQSYNSQRKQHNEDRTVFLKGSVFAVSVPEDFHHEAIPFHIGCLQNEGFGRIALNPPFLNGNITDETRQRPEETDAPQKKREDSTINLDIKTKELIIGQLQRRSEQFQQDICMEKIVDEFQCSQAKYFKSISKSQWGAIRGIAKSTTDVKQLEELLFSTKEGFLRRGIAQQHWDGKWQILEQFLTENMTLDSRLLLIKLASKMQKNTKDNGK